MTDLIDTVQLQEIDDALIHLFDITLPSGTNIFLFNGLDAGSDNIYFSNKAGTVLNEYISFPIQVEGIEMTASGAQNRPTLSMANIPVLTRSITNDADGLNDEETISDILQDEGITTNEDLLNSVVLCRSTLLKYTQRQGDAAEVPVEFPSARYIVDRVSGETNIAATFELASPFDIEGTVIPNRVVIGRYCPWKYQGYALDNDGGCAWPLDSNGIFFDINDQVITKNISSISTYSSASTYSTAAKVKTITGGHTQIWEALRNVPTNKNPLNNPLYWKRLDVCGKLITSCKVRFQGNSTDTTLDTSITLPFGGFPGSKKFK